MPPAVGLAQFNELTFGGIMKRCFLVMMFCAVCVFFAYSLQNDYLTMIENNQDQELIDSLKKTEFKNAEYEKTIVF